MMGKISMACSARMLSSRTSRRAWVFWGGGEERVRQDLQPRRKRTAMPAATLEGRGGSSARPRARPPRGARLREAGLMEDKGHDFTPTWNI